MSDESYLADWQPTYETWKENALPMLMQGKGKEAFETYPWFKPRSAPFVRPAKPLSEARVGLVTTGGYSIEGEQEPFDLSRPLRDMAPELRAIPLGVDRSKLRIDHMGYDHRFAKEDLNVNLPLDRLAELAEEGKLGSVAPTTHVLMGMQPNVAPLVLETIPHLAERLRSEDVDVALLVPS